MTAQFDVFGRLMSCWLHPEPSCLDFASCPRVWLQEEKCNVFRENVASWASCQMTDTVGHLEIVKVKDISDENTPSHIHLLSFFVCFLGPFPNRNCGRF